MIWHVTLILIDYPHRMVSGAGMGDETVPVATDYFFGEEQRLENPAVGQSPFWDPFERTKSWPLGYFPFSTQRGDESAYFVPRVPLRIKVRDSTGAASVIVEASGALAELILGQGDYQPFRMRW